MSVMFWVLFVLFDLLVLGWIWTRSLSAEAERPFLRRGSACR
jgi:hypothetical protein